jgi:hypothetical protein
VKASKWPPLLFCFHLDCKDDDVQEAVTSSSLNKTATQIAVHNNNHHHHATTKEEWSVIFCDICKKKEMQEA